MEQSVLRRGVGSRGPPKGHWWGPGGNAPAGFQGAEPPEAAGFSGFFKTPKRLSSHSFSFIFKTNFSAKSFDIVRYKMI